jgi:hypothetical protein
MALLYSDIQAMTQEHIRPKLIDNIFNGAPILKRLRNKLNVTVDGGAYIKQDIIYAKKTSSGVYNGWGTILTAPNESITAVKYDWGHRYTSMGIPWTDELLNSGKAAVIKKLTTEAQIAELTLVADLTSDVFATSTVTSGIQGIPLMIDDSASTDYAGIDATDFAGWAASCDTSSTVMTIPLLQGKFGDCSDGEEVPTLIVSNQDNFDKYFAILESKPHFRVEDANGNLKFRNADWIVDKASPGSGSGTADNQIFFINEKFIEFYVHPLDNFKIWDWQTPINQIGKIAKITFTGQLATSNRRRHGKITTINPAL